MLCFYTLPDKYKTGNRLVRAFQSFSLLLSDKRSRTKLLKSVLKHLATSMHSWLWIHNKTTLGLALHSCYQLTSIPSVSWTEFLESAHCKKCRNCFKQFVNLIFCWESVVQLVTDATHFNFLQDIPVPLEQNQSNLKPHGVDERVRTKKNRCYDRRRVKSTISAAWTKQKKLKTSLILHHTWGKQFSLPFVSPTVIVYFQQFDHEGLIHSKQLILRCISYLLQSGL